MSEPWGQREGETAKAFAMFSLYLKLGPKRSAVEAFRQFSGKKQAKGAPGYITKWQSKHGWVERSNAWDAKRTTSEISAHETALKLSREALHETLVENVLVLIGIAQGTSQANMVRFLAVKEAISLAGLVVVKKNELSGPGGKPVQTQSMGLSDESVDVIKEKIFGIKRKP